MPSEGNLGHLDRDLVGRCTDNIDLSDLGGVRKLVANPLAERLQREGVDVTTDRDVSHPVPSGQLSNDRLFGFDREGGDRVDIALDVVDHLAGIGVELELDHHHAHAFIGG